MATAKIHRILSTLGPPHRESPGRSSPCALPGLAHESKHPHLARSDDPPVSVPPPTGSVSAPRSSRMCC